MSTDEAVLLFKDEAGVRWLTLNRPERKNSINAELREELLMQLDDARANDDVRCVVITGSGDAFCSGVDLARSGATKDANAPQRTTPDLRAIREAMKRGMQRVIAAIWNLDKPVICSLNGTAAGGGAQLALVCDLVIAAESARLIEIFAKRGLAVDSGGGWLLPRLVGMHRAKELVFFGDAIGAKDALDIGLVNKVVADAALEDATREWAEKLASGATRAIGLSKRLLNAAFETDLAGGLEMEADAQALNALNDDFREGVRAFAEKRAPDFKGC